MKKQEGKILVVDDEESIRELCQRYLLREGFQVTAVDNGEKALEEIYNNKFSLVISDIKMPGIGGLELLKKIKDYNPNLDVIIITGYPAVETAVQTLKNGAYDYILKPIDFDEFKIVVKRCIYQQKLKQELDVEKTIRRELRIAYRNLKKAEKMKEKFLATISHELKTPLTAIIGYTELLYDDSTEQFGRFNELQHDLVCSIKNSSEHLLKLVNDLLDFIKLEKQEFLIKKKEFDIKELMTEIHQEFSILAKVKDITVTLSLDDKLPQIITTDPKVIQQVFKRLIANAINFTHHSGKIELEVQCKGRNLIFSVIDNGIGIPEGEFSHIFDKFYQVADYLTREVGGMGLGLAFVKSMLNACGGNVWVESKVGEGSKFYFTLPLEA